MSKIFGMAILRVYFVSDIRVGSRLDLELGLNIGLN